MLALADDTPCPTVAAADFPVFALACQQPGNNVSWANFIVGRAHVRWYTNRIARRPRAKAINGLLKAVAHAAPGIDAAIARVRGAQAQLLLAGIHTAIDPRELRGIIAEHHLTRPDNAPHDCYPATRSPRSPHPPQHASPAAADQAGSCTSTTLTSTPTASPSTASQRRYSTSRARWSTRNFAGGARNPSAC